MSDSEKELVYYNERLIGGPRIMYSDTLDFDLKSDDSLFPAITLPDRDDVNRAYETLKPGSTPLVPMKGTTYSSHLWFDLLQIRFYMNTHDKTKLHVKL